MKVLFVDDDENLLEQAEIYFEHKKIEPLTIQSSEEALERLRNENFDAVVCDYKMPEMDGLELLKKLRREGYDVPFIIFTGQGREEVAMKALNLGADRYIQKGGDPKIQYSVLADAIKQEAEHWKTKKELTSAEKKYKDLAEKSLVGVYVIQDDLFKYVNPEFCRIFNYEREELLNKDYRELVAPESMKKVVEGVSKRQEAEGEPAKYYFKALTKEKEKIDVEVFSVPSSYQGRPAVQGTLIDITESKKRERDLRENKKKIENLHDIFEEMRTLSEPKKVYNYTVKVAQDILDFDICSVDVAEDGMLKVKATSDEMPPDSSFNSPVDEGIGGKTYQNNESFLIENVIEKPEADPKNPEFKSGISVPIEDHGVFQAVSYEEDYFDQEDLRMGNLLASQTAQSLNSINKERELESKKKKITSLHHVAFELKDCKSIQEVFDRTVELAKQVLDFDLCGVIIDESGEAVVKAASKDVPEEAKKVTKMNEGIVGKVYKDKGSLLIKDIDNYSLKEPKLSEYKSGVSIPILDMGVFQAISEEEAYFDEEDLEMAEILVAHMENEIKRIKSDNMKRFMVTLLRHDMKNKANIVDGYLDLLEDYELDDELMEIIHNARRSSKEVIDFIDKLGLLKELDKEKQGEEYSLEQVLNSVISDIEGEFRKSGISIEYELDSEKVIGGNLLEDLFFNLLENSKKHSNCSKIWIYTEEDDDHVSVIVEDDGEGIDEAIADEVFDKGIKGEGSSGTGIGLYLVRKIAEFYGGEARVESSSHGGSKFIIRLKKV